MSRAAWPKPSAHRPRWDPDSAFFPQWSASVDAGLAAPEELQQKALELAGVGEGTEAVSQGDGIKRTPTFTPTSILD